MFSKHVGRINLLLLDRKDEKSSLRESFTIRCSRTSRHNRSLRNSISTAKPRYDSELSLIKKEIPEKYEKLLESLFKSKCLALIVDSNRASLQSFLKAFMAKNKFIDGQLGDGTINLSDFGLNDKSMLQINAFLRQNLSLVNVKLSKNLINPNNLVRLQTIKELSLGNCKLGNQCLELLFTKLHVSLIEKLCLSSPQVKNRNQLTKYKALISLIQSTKTLTTLQLGNMDIQPDCLIIESCKNTTVKHLDLSDNTNVKGNCPTLLSLNLTRNGITVPFTYPMLPNQIQVLNLSYNKIPHFQFKQFLKYSYFANIRKLILDYNKLSEDILCFQLFLEQTTTLVYLSLVGCDLGHGGFLSIAHGVKGNRSLESLNLSWNRILNEKVADYVSHMLQGCILKEIKLRHCDIKDSIGERIFRNIRRNKTLQKIYMKNNLLGDKTAKVICHELKYAKTIIVMELQSNIIKFSDIHQIQGYLDSNKYLGGHQLDKQYQKLMQTNTQLVEANVILNSDTQRISRLEKQTEQLHLQYITKFKVENQQKKKRLREKIYDIRDSENQLMTDITLMQALPTLQELNSMQSRRESFIENHNSFYNL